MSKNADLVLRSPFQALGQSLHRAGSIRIQKAGKLHCRDVNATFSFEMARDIHEKGLIISKNPQIVQKWKL